jgi:hypothetical protein
MILWKFEKSKSYSLKLIFMKWLFIIGFLAFISACGENNNKKNSGDLVELENDWMHAMAKKDKPVLDQLVAPEFTVTGMKYIDSAAVTRSMWMQNILQDMRIDTVHFLKIKPTTTEEVGIVKAQFYWSGSYGESHFADTLSFVDTWVKRSGDWRVVSRIITD